MNRHRWLHPHAGPLGLALLALLVLGSLSLWGGPFLEPDLGPPLPWLGFAAVGAVLALHRPFGGRGLAAGVAVVPPLAVLAGPMPAAWGAAAALAVAELARGWAAGRLPLALPNRVRPLVSLAAVARTALSALAGAVTWRLLLPAGEAPAGAPWGAAAAGGGAFVVTSLLLRAAERDWRVQTRPPSRFPGRRSTDAERERRRRRASWRARLRRRLPARSELGSTVTELVGWAAGALVTAASGGDPAGRGVALALLALLAVPVVEAARLAGVRSAVEERMGQLDRVRNAGQRMVGGVPEMEAVVDRIREECGNVVPYGWFQFELLPGDGWEGRSWWATAGGRLAEGRPDPDPHPPPLPGIHKRSEWRVVERSLAWGEHAGARLRLWCDPRRLEVADLELLDVLLPHMAASIRQSLLDREAREDRLTGAAVRRELEKRLLLAFRGAVDEGRSLAVIMCDLDHFKMVNDSFGHLVGDRALAAVASMLARHKRGSDLLARYGGEEFTLLLEDADGAAALAVAERLRRAVEELEFEVDGAPVPLTVSAGVASFPELHVKTPTELLLLADGALYEAKRRGRNRCLLDLGTGRYRDPRGEVFEAEARRPPPEAPRIFA